jgi:hydroxypyruvate isomerase
MPRFAANLGFLWSERPLLKRIEAAAKADRRAPGFRAEFKGRGGQGGSS